MVRELKAALFDLDGVVFNTEPQYTMFWKSQFSMYHPELPGIETQIKGMTLVEIYDKYFAGMLEEQSKITAKLNEFEVNMHFEFIEGFVDFVTNLRNNRVKTAVVTSSNRQKMENVYAKVPAFKNLFDSILTSEDFTEGKPNPAPYLKGAEVFGLIPSLCVGFEDSFNGLKAVRGAGEFTVGLSTTNAETAIRAYADIVIPNYVGFNYQWLNGEFNKH